MDNEEVSSLILIYFLPFVPLLFLYKLETKWE
jgi:hypothetical protein